MNTELVTANKSTLHFIETITDRFSVAQSCLAVIRGVKKTMKPGAWWTITNRKEVMQTIANRHKENKQLYYDIIKGKL